MLLKNNCVNYFDYRIQKSAISQNLSEGVLVILQDLWKELPENKLYPLISRVARNIVLIKPENMTRVLQQT